MDAEGELIENKTEQVVLTPKKKSVNSTTLWIERKRVENAKGRDEVYVAGGAHRGIIVNKKDTEDDINTTPAQISIEFRVFLVNRQTGKSTQELRKLKYWFRPVLESDAKQAAIAQEFFGDLVHPKDFPRDYVGFIKKIMKLLQSAFREITRIELVLSQLEASEIAEQPLSVMDSNSESMKMLSVERIIEVMEWYYPNPVVVQDLANEHDWDESEIRNILNKLRDKGIVKSLDQDCYTRMTQDDTDIIIVKQMPRMVKAHQPRIAIITAQFAEKLAVDALIENKETFVRYTTVGESNVYTLGNIGEHRIVCTKLPSVGHTREAMTAAGNTTTRLLGTFQNVDHIILVGGGGGVPHFTDYNKHIRLGDVVISHFSPQSQSVFISCNGAVETSPGVLQFDCKKYRPRNGILQNIAAQIKVHSRITEAEYIWKHLDQGIASLSRDTGYDFKRPQSETDKLYMAVGERDLIEVSHPVPQGNDSKRVEGRPRLHLGIVGAGREVAISDYYRQKFSQEYCVSAFVPEFDPVVESITGNCRDSFIFVRGICDYKDGTKKSEWLPYAALAAASVTKVIIAAIDPNYA